MKRALFVLAGCLMMIIQVSGQHRQVLLGDSLYRHYSYVKAIRHYEKALKKVDRKGPVHEKLGNSYYQLQDYDQAQLHYNEARDGLTSWNEETRWNYLQVQRTLGNDQLVRKLVADWGIADQQSITSLATGLLAEDLYYMDSAAYEIKLAEVNSDRSEFAPAYFRDGLVFTSSRKEGNTSNRKYHWDGGYYLDLYYSSLKRGPSGDIDIVPVGNNTNYHDGPVVFYNNDSQVIFTRNEQGKSRDGLRTLVLMQADVSPSGQWENVRVLPMNKENYSMSHPALSADGRKLYFVSDMPGGQGGTDIWYSRREGDSWGEPVNMGPSVNTSEDEMFPAVYGTQLLFASNGHPGLGGLDIFIAEPLPGEEYLIRNAGYPLNTRKDDFGLITRDGRTGYFSSNRAGQDDIYSFTRDKIPVDIFYVTTDEMPLDSVSTEWNGIEVTPRKDHTHLLLPMNAVSDINASRSGYGDTTFSVTTNEEFYLAKTIPLASLSDLDRGLIEIYPIASEDRVDFYLGTPDDLIHVDKDERWLKRLDVRQIEELPDYTLLDKVEKILDQNGYDTHLNDTISAIFFDFDKYDIRSGEKSNLSRLIRLLDRYPKAKIIVSAHTDARGSHAYNDKLADRRANATRDYLIASGITSDRILMKVYGERMLWIECAECTESQHQLNRRATFGVNKEE